MAFWVLANEVPHCSSGYLSAGECLNCFGCWRLEYGPTKARGRLWIIGQRRQSPNANPNRPWRTFRRKSSTKESMRQPSEIHNPFGSLVIVVGLTTDDLRVMLPIFSV